MARAIIDFTATQTGFEAVAKGVKGQLHELKGMVAGAFAVGAIASFVGKTVEYADTIDKTSQRMKMTVEQTQALSIVAKDAGSSLDVVEGAFNKIEKARAKALGGDKKSLAAFAVAGIDVKDLQKGNNTAQIAGKLGQAKANGSNDTEGVALQALGLKSAAGDIQLISEQLLNLDTVTAGLQSKGAIMDDNTVNNLVMAQDKLELASTTLMASVAPYLSDIIDGLQMGFIIIEAILTGLFTYWIGAFDLIKSKIGDIIEFVKHPITGTAKLLSGQSNPFSGIKELVGGSFGEIGSDISKGLDEYTSNQNAELEKRRKARENKPEADSIAIAPKEAKVAKDAKNSIYSDSLSGGGNMLGQAYANLKSVSIQMELQKQQLSETQKQTDLQKKQVDFLQTIANKDDTNKSDDWN